MKTVGLRREKRNQKEKKTQPIKKKLGEGKQIDNNNNKHIFFCWGEVLLIIPVICPS
jgi:hypothetical protein